MIREGIYEVTESGVKFKHEPGLPNPKNAAEYLSRFKSKFRMRVLEHPNENELVFEVEGIDVSFANALRRIMIAEVPTMGIEHVYMFHNTSIVHDEVLAHRIGLVPIDVDPRFFDPLDDESEATDRNTLVFRLNVTCAKSKEEEKELPEIVNPPEDSIGGNSVADLAAETASKIHHGGNMTAVEIPGRPYTKHVYSSDLQWTPQGDQASRFPDGIRPVHEDILLAKLRPGQNIELEAHARLGDGKDHAKFSPVATACYRLMPQVELVHDVYDDLADELDKYEPGVFKIVPCNEDGHSQKAVVDNPYACTMSRNFMRNPELKEAVRITRKADHFIFSVESVGMLPASTILAESFSVLKAKCQNVTRLANESLEGEMLNC